MGYFRGGHHIVRLLNTPGARMHDILLDGLIDTSPGNMRCRAAVKIGDSQYGGGERERLLFASRFHELPI
jgi:hypothetical protein